MLREVISYIINTDRKTIKADWVKYCALRKECNKAHRKSDSAYWRLVRIDTIPSSEKPKPACLLSRSVMFRDFSRDEGLESSYFLTECQKFNGGTTPCNPENLKCPFFFRNHAYIDAQREYQMALQKKCGFVKEVLTRRK